MHAVVCVPRRADPERDRLWAYSRRRWEACGLEIHEGHHDEGPFNRSAGLNRAAEQAGAWDVAVCGDGDVIVDPWAVGAACRRAAATGGLVLAFTRRGMLHQKATRRILDGDETFDWTRHVKRWDRDNLSTALAVRRDLWDRLGGFDERFQGWGWEDIAFMHAGTTLSGLPIERITADVFHLWHTPPAMSNWSRHPRRTWPPEFRASADLAHRYYAARGKPDAITDVLAGKVAA